MFIYFTSFFHSNEQFPVQKSINLSGLSGSSLGFRQSSDDVRISSVGDWKGAYTEIFTAGSSQFDVVAVVVMDTSLGQHGVILDFRFSEGWRNEVRAEIWRDGGHWFKSTFLWLSHVVSKCLSDLRLLHMFSQTRRHGNILLSQRKILLTPYGSIQLS